MWTSLDLELELLENLTQVFEVFTQPSGIQAPVVHSFTLLVLGILLNVLVQPKLNPSYR